MSCQNVRETFHQAQDPPEHCSHCEECQLEWTLHLAMRSFKAKSLGEDFNRRVLASLENKGHFEVNSTSKLESFWRVLTRVLPPLTMAACLLLFLWMGNLATHRPSPELRSLPPSDAQLWSNLPDAVPPQALPGPAPSRQQTRLVKRDQL